MVYGGEEFVVVLPHTNTQQAVAESIRKEIASLQILHQDSGVDDFVNLSIGVASLIPTPVETPAIIIHQADQALYAAKSQGRNQAIAM